MAEISSITLPGGGTYDLKDKNAVPKYGMGKNFLRNWYFVGGGTGRGVFPVNQRGQSSYSGQNYSVDGWKIIKGTSTEPVLSVTSEGLVCTNNSTYIQCTLGDNTSAALSEKYTTLSLLDSSGILYTISDVVHVYPNASNFGINNSSVYLYIISNASKVSVGFRCKLADTTKAIVAVKLELGTKQTLCHNEGTAENPVWVLNEIPDYEYELYRCITSTADPSDTYANKVLSINIPNKNLLDNWYFLNPVNQRGQTTLSSNGYFIDRWTVANNSNYGAVSLVSDGLSITHSQNTGYTQISQVINNLSGKECTLSGIIDGVLRSCTLIFSNQANSIVFGRLLVFSVSNLIIIRCPASTSDVIIKALKLELGTEQTLAHQENETWVLNEIPDYEEELIKCQTSTADSSDTYANKSLATEQQIAYVETGTTTSRAYAAGEYFCWHGLLYRAKTAISSGGTITPGSNCELKSEGGMNSLSNQIIVRRQVLANSITTGLNTLQVEPTAIAGYKAIGVAGVQFPAIDRTKISLVEFLLDGGTYITVQFNSTYTKTSGISVAAFVIYAKE